MKVAFFTESLPPSTDGVANTLNRLANTLVAKDIEFYFFSTFKPDENTEWTDRVFKVASFPLYFIYPHYRVGVPALHNIDDMLDDFKPDIIHAVTPTPLGLRGLNYAREKKIPAVSSYHTHFVDYFKYYKLQSMEHIGWNYLKWFYNQFDRIYVPSPSTANELRARGFGKLELWARGIDTAMFSPNKRSDELRRSIGVTDEPILLFVGRLVKEKDLDDLIEANSILKAQGSRYKIVVVGDGHMREQLETEMPDAHFTGYLYGEELAKWYASSDIFAFPSTTETFGNVILEASASGLPIVGVDKGSVQDLIRHNSTGFVAKANDPIDFAASLLPLIEDSAKRKEMGGNAQELAKQYSWDAINSRLVHSYQRMIFNYSMN
ncbi:glycosyltransferase family 1 protein [candidate division KSB1 bacterium]|nr:glycosyltransferase family 1 protein [candidate division KSB1 bacterium]